MSKTVFKYKVLPSTEFEIQMPRHAEILTVQVQNEEVFMWARVDTEEDCVYRRFGVFGTGHDMPDKALVEPKYIGTFQLCGGSIVFHLFEF